ncbi:MAG: tyrosine-type recombinase/integrase, partial [Acidimicrobiales bacterium]
MAYIKKRNGRWQAAYRGPDRRERTRTFDRKVDAERWLAGQTADVIRGAWVDPAAGRLTLGDYADKWLDRRTDLRPTTRAKYISLLGRHILPVLGATSLGQIQPSAVRGWYMSLRGEHPVTADDSYRLLRAVLNTAVADEVILRNPCRVKGAGQVRSPERPTASVAELAAAVEATPEQYRLALLLPAWCQLRRGEVLALQRRHVSVVPPTVRVEQAWTVTTGGRLVLGPPKTEAGVRALAVPANVVPVLANHLARFVGPEPDAWLFATGDGAALSPRTLDRVWARARRPIGRPDLHLHDLRHSGLTWAAASGASVAELMRRGGHANPRAALGYQHATEDRDQAIADALAGL